MIEDKGWMDEKTEDLFEQAKQQVVFKYISMIRNGYTDEYTHNKEIDIDLGYYIFHNPESTLEPVDIKMLSNHIYKIL